MSCNFPVPVRMWYFNDGTFYRRQLIEDPVLHPQPIPLRSADVKIFELERKGEIFSYDTVQPCGMCMACRITNSMQMTSRLMMESTCHEFSWDVTLTYDDAFVPISPVGVDIDPDTGEVISEEGALTLRYRDVKLFLMRLRKKLGKPFRYYYVGEYGDSTNRPHYHMILFGIDKEFIDPKIFGKSKSGYPIWISENLSALWKNGYITVQQVEYGSLAYVAGYVQKKMYGRDPHSKMTWYEAHGVEPEKSISSNRPGIGAVWFDNLSEDEIYRYLDIGKLYLSKKGKTIEVPFPRYFKRRFARDHPLYLESDFAFHQEERQEQFDLRVLSVESQTDRTYLQTLEDREILQYNNKRRQTL